MCNYKASYYRIQRQLIGLGPFHPLDEFGRLFTTQGSSPCVMYQQSLDTIERNSITLIRAGCVEKSNL